MTRDGAGRLVDLIGPTVDGEDAMSATHGYDARGRLSSVSEASLGTFGFGFDLAGRPSRLTRPGDVVTETTYDDSGRTLAITTTDGLGALVHEIATTWDDRGLPATQTDHEGTHVYTHDAAGRLTGVDHPAGAVFDDESYSYDAAGRRTSSHRDPAGEVVYDDGDRLLQDASYTYSYDLEGRRRSRTHRVSGAVTTYEFNVLDQLTSLTEDGVTWSFVYDARDLRVQVRNDAGYGESFVYDENGLVRASFDLAGDETASYLTGAGFGEVLARVTDEVEQALRDRLGTTLGWMTVGGPHLDLVDRDTLGARGTTEGRVVVFGFTGHADDPLGVSWARARSYEPTVGAWISEDPEFMHARYTYVDGRAAWSVDPTGRSVAVEYGTMDGITLGVYQFATRLMAENAVRNLIAAGYFAQIVMVH